jgi:antitoxin MazE
MKATVKTWGNSLALRIPRQVTEQLALADGSDVDVSVESGELRIRVLKKPLTLDDLIAAEPPLEDTDESREIGWGKPIGNEIW